MLQMKKLRFHMNESRCHMNKSIEQMMRGVFGLANTTMRSVFCLVSVAMLWVAVAGAQAPPAGPATGPGASKAPGPVPGPAIVRPPGDRVAGAEPQSAGGVDGSEAMFTTMGALLAAGFEADVSTEPWPADRVQSRQA